MEMSEGGLSMIEKRILLELFSGIGINEIHIDESLMNLTQKQLIEYKKWLNLAIELVSEKDKEASWSGRLWPDHPNLTRTLF